MTKQNVDDPKHFKEPHNSHDCLLSSNLAPVVQMTHFNRPAHRDGKGPVKAGQCMYVLSVFYINT